LSGLEFASVDKNGQRSSQGQDQGYQKIWSRGASRPRLGLEDYVIDYCNALLAVFALRFFCHSMLQQMSRVLRTTGKRWARRRATRSSARHLVTSAGHLIIFRQPTPVNHPAGTSYRSSPSKNSDTWRTFSEHSPVSTVYSVFTARCYVREMSVRPSIWLSFRLSHAGILSKPLHVSSNFLAVG